jgi:hypothetical protein
MSTLTPAPTKLNYIVWPRVTLFILIWFLLGISVCVAWGQRPPSHTVRGAAIPSHAQPNRGASSITFLTARSGSPVHSLGSDQGVLDLGSFSFLPRSDVNDVKIQRLKDSFIASTRFGLRIDLSNGHGAGTATVSAFLLSSDPLKTIWVDGVRLSMTPGIIGGQVSYGVITEHVLKIAVPTSMPAGQLLDSIGVIVTPN